MKGRSPILRLFAPLLLLGSLPARVLADDVLETTGFQPCLANADIHVDSMNIKFERDSKVVTFDVSGTSEKVQNVTGTLSVYAYGHQVYNSTFNPCDQKNYVAQLCPVPKGHFAAQGSQTIPDQYANKIPSIAYTIPDLDGVGKLELQSLDSGAPLACIESTVGNSKTLDAPAVQYVAVGIAGGALLVSGLSALTNAGGHGASSSPTFTEVVHWFQGLAMNGMLSVQYPSIYRSFTQNFAFSTGLVPWDSVQRSIDNFRASTGGNLTQDNVDYLRNSTIVYTDSASAGLQRRAFTLFERAVDTSVNGTHSTVGNGTSSTNSTTSDNKSMNFVHGIAGYVEQLTIPQANTFMTVLLVFAIVVAAITASILLFKVILEAWALIGNFPKSLTSFRKRYWWIMAQTITNLILLLYGVWTLYCVYQFTNGDSWAAKTLAGVTLGIFTVILVGFTIQIYRKAHQFKRVEGDTTALFEDKTVWTKYRIFYENYKKSYWWLFVPVIIYMFAKGCVIAGANGHGLVQAGGQLIVEAIMLVLLLWLRPFNKKSGNWINIIIQVVRVLSVVCILVFVEEFGISQTTKTVTGVILIATQAVLTGVLAILIAVNAIINCVRMNPHRRQRKEAEKLNRDLDDLTPLDARNSLLMHPVYGKLPQVSSNEVMSQHSRGRSQNYDMVPFRDVSADPGSRESFSGHQQPRLPDLDTNHSRRPSSVMSLGGQHRQPQLPDLGYKGVAI